MACRRWRDISRLQAPPANSKVEAARQISPEPILSVEAIRLGYGNQRGWGFSGLPTLDVVRDLSFTINQGETFALVGESGSGKSTVARAVSGLHAPTMAHQVRGPGSAWAGAQPLARTPPRIQYIFQNPDASLNPRARIGTILARPIEMFFNLGRTVVGKRDMGALDDVRLDASTPPPFSRSAFRRRAPARGDRTRAGRRLEAPPVRRNPLRPRCFGSSEHPVAPATLRREHNLSMLFISHDLAVVRTLAERVGVLFRGQLMGSGRCRRHLFPRRFIPTPTSS